MSEHGEQRYIERIGVRKNMSVQKSLEKDLHYKRIKKIVDKTDTKHVFTFGRTEFIFSKKGSKLILKTVIRHNVKSEIYKQQKVQNEKNLL